MPFPDNSVLPEGMSAVEWLIAIEEIRQLKARRDRYVDSHDWDGYADLHAPDHVSHHAPDPALGAAPEPWTSVHQMMENIRRQMPDTNYHTIHHSYDPEFHFETPVKARAIWAMTAAIVSQDADGKSLWNIGYGYYYESYQKRDGRWLFTSRRWQRHFGVGGGDKEDAIRVTFPKVALKGRDAFDDPAIWRS